ncbi:hypothetical protein B0H13DRAFT_2669476 [Mycena leptocephala]|nr:hypothetical protein B0H13DRAFT_2669476 [Mycena leptocephala]
MQQGKWMNMHEARSKQARSVSGRRESSSRAYCGDRRAGLLRERIHSSCIERSHPLREDTHPQPSTPRRGIVYPENARLASQSTLLLPTHVFRPRKYDAAASKYSIPHVVRNELSYTPLVPLQRLTSPLTKLAHPRASNLAPPRASKHASLATVHIQPANAMMPTPLTS